MPQASLFLLISAYFNNMNLNKKHKLLSTFNDHFLQQTNNGATKDISKSISVIELIYFNKWSNKNLEELYTLIEQLIVLGYIKSAETDSKCSREEIKYFITPEGRVAYYNQYFLNLALHRDKKFLIPLIISVIAVLFSAGTLKYNMSNNSKIDKLQEEIETLKKDKSLLIKKSELLKKGK